MLILQPRLVLFSSLIGISNFLSHTNSVFALDENNQELARNSFGAVGKPALSGVWPSASSESDSWNYWWSYSGVSGPTYWGLLNSEWLLCDKGRRQSPVNINTRSLVYDPHLGPLNVDNNLISGILLNDGHSIVFNASLASAAQAVLHSRMLSDEANSTSATNANALGLDQNIQLKKRHAAEAISHHSFETDRGSLMKHLRQDVELSIGQGNRLLGGESDEEAYNHHQRGSRMRKTRADGQQQPGPADDQQALSLQQQQQMQQQQLEEHLQSIASKTVRFHGAGLAYSYQFEAFHLRFGSDDTQASEHRLNDRAFAAELQFFAYNWLLYKDFTEASSRPSGLLAISIFVDAIDDSGYIHGEQQPQQQLEMATSPQPDENSSPKPHLTDSNGQQPANERLEQLLKTISTTLRYRGQFVHLHELNLLELLSNSSMREFVTYEGSLSWPGCHESATWLILNKPLYARGESLDKLRTLSADEQAAAQSSGTFIAGNIRPVQPLNGRPIRTNIRPASVKSGEQESCARLWTQYEYKAK